MFPFEGFCVILSGNWSRRLVVQDAWFSSRKSRVRLPPGLPYKDYTFDTKRYLKEPRFIGVLLGIVYDHQHAIKDKDEHYALSL